jgi:hypothetical protein
LAPAPKAPKAGTTLMLLAVDVPLVEEPPPPPQPASNTKGSNKHEISLRVFMIF